jgi:hypothetical protein
MKHLILLSIILLFFCIHPFTAFADAQWQFQSIDTMKISRDMAREKLKDKSFDSVIDLQVKKIKETGATYVAIATPYDDEFVPYLERWVMAARKYNLHVWFRGNFSGWEKWFDYPSISRASHLKKTQKFIMSHPTLFEKGDVFTSCPECENGGPGDPRKGDVNGFRKFLIDEYTTASEAFAKINKDVTANYYSMNGDVARLVMDKPTTQKLGGVVVIDHYVKSPEKLAADIRDIAKSSGGKVVLGEFGAPIPDIHGALTDQEQNKWLQQTLQSVSWMPELIGVSYWTSFGGSTKLWEDDGRAHSAVSTLTSFYTASVFHGKIFNDIDLPVGGVKVVAMGKETISNDEGEFTLPYIPPGKDVTIISKSYNNKTVKAPENQKVIIHLTKQTESRWYKFIHFIKNIFSFKF